MKEKDSNDIIASLYQIEALSNCVRRGFFESNDWNPQSGREIISFDCLCSAKEDYKIALTVIADLAAAAAEQLDIGRAL